MLPLNAAFSGVPKRRLREHSYATYNQQYANTCVIFAMLWIRQHAGTSALTHPSVGHLKFSSTFALLFVACDLCESPYNF